MIGHKAVQLFDFDRTLFDTARFVDWLWEHIALTYHVDGESEKQQATRFYQYEGEWYDYRFFDHLASISAITDPVEVFVERCRHAAPDDFLFADVDEVLDEIDSILTFGNEPYQRFKLSFAPKLARTPSTIIQSDKASYVTQAYHGQPVVLVDDKRLETNLPPSARFIHLDRTQTEPLIAHETYTSIASLTSFRRAISGH